MPVLDALFDSDAFNRRVFFPRGDASVCAGASDVFVDVDALSSSTLSSSEKQAARLHLRLHPCDGQQVRVLLFHGNGEVVADYDDAAAYAAVGAGLAVVDFRGYGQSTGIPSLRAIVDDAAAVVRAVVAHDGGRPIVVMGRSLGSLCAAEVAGGDDARADAHRGGLVDGIVIESGIARLSGLIERRGMPVPKMLAGSRFDPLPKVARGRRPLLVLHGENDEIIDVGEGQQLFDVSTAARKTLCRVPGRGHNDISGARVYWDALRQFIASVAEQRA